MAESARVATTAAYPPIDDYAAIGDCRTVALVSRSGSIDWLCLPYFSAPSLFAALLDRSHGGCFAVSPSAPCTVERRYADGSTVLETTFCTAEGRARLTDLLPIPVSGAEPELRPQREVLRIIEGLAGQVDFEVTFAPRPDYARARHRIERRGQLGWACVHGAELFLLHTDLMLEQDDYGDVVGSVRIEAGERRYLSLVYAGHDIAVIAPLGAAAEQRRAETLAWWRDWSGRCRYEGAYAAAVQRSVLTLKLMTYALSGAVVAAPTVGLPEQIGGGRNWDYRYCWLRDASLTMRAFIDLGYQTEGDMFLGWLLHATRLTLPRLQVLYDVYGETELPEQVLDLEGYRGSRPVRIGNDAKDQLQLDNYGAVILATSDYLRRGGTLDRYEARVLAGFGKVVCQCWREPDNGIWEVRGERRQHTYSKLMCWAALDCLLRLHAEGIVQIDKNRCEREHAALRDAIETHGYDAERNSYTGVFGQPDPDAALLLMPRYGYCDPNAPRMQGTYAYIERTLGQGPLLSRYPPGYDRMPPGEGAFGIACFWAVDYLARAGRLDEAHERFRRLLAYANEVGLYAEEIDPSTGAALGNFPQAFTHVGLITAALSLARAGDGS